VVGTCARSSWRAWPHSARDAPKPRALPGCAPGAACTLGRCSVSDVWACSVGTSCTRVLLRLPAMMEPSRPATYSKTQHSVKHKTQQHGKRNATKEIEIPPLSMSLPRGATGTRMLAKSLALRSLTAEKPRVLEDSSSFSCLCSMHSARFLRVSFHALCIPLRSHSSRLHREHFSQRWLSQCPWCRPTQIRLIPLADCYK